MSCNPHRHTPQRAHTQSLAHPSSPHHAAEALLAPPAARRQVPHAHLCHSFMQEFISPRASETVRSKNSRRARLTGWLAVRKTPRVASPVHPMAGRSAPLPTNHAHPPTSFGPPPAATNKRGRPPPPPPPVLWSFNLKDTKANQSSTTPPLK